jgi:hypothetical protein
LAKNSKALDSNWHYPYASKSIENMPSWKKEIYEKNYSATSYWAVRSPETGKLVESKNKK